MPHWLFATKDPTDRWVLKLFKIDDILTEDPSVPHACDNAASLLCLRDLHGASGSSCPSLSQHLQQQTAEDTIQGNQYLKWTIKHVSSKIQPFSHPFQSMALYSWYSWMYAINVIIYVVSSSHFRKVYRIFFADIIAGICTLSGKVCFFREGTSSAIELGRVQ